MEALDLIEIEKRMEAARLFLRDHAAAETTIATHDAAEISFKSAQSLLSMAKTQIGLA